MGMLLQTRGSLASNKSARDLEELGEDVLPTAQSRSFQEFENLKEEALAMTGAMAETNANSTDKGNWKCYFTWILLPESTKTRKFVLWFTWDTSAGPWESAHDSTCETWI